MKNDHLLQQTLIPSISIACIHRERCSSFNLCQKHKFSCWLEINLFRFFLLFFFWIRAWSHNFQVSCNLLIFYDFCRLFCRFFCRLLCRLFYRLLCKLFYRLLCRVLSLAILLGNLIISYLQVHAQVFWVSLTPCRN